MTKIDAKTLTYFQFLDDLRASGATNMFGAGEYLTEAFDMSKGDARKVLTHWMNTFSERQAEKGLPQ